MMIPIEWSWMGEECFEEMRMQSSKFKAKPDELLNDQSRNYLNPSEDWKVGQQQIPSVLINTVTDLESQETEFNLIQLTLRSEGPLLLESVLYSSSWSVFGHFSWAWLQSHFSIQLQYTPLTQPALDHSHHRLSFEIRPKHRSTTTPQTSLFVLFESLVCVFFFFFNHHTPVFLHSRTSRHPPAPQKKASINLRSWRWEDIWAQAQCFPLLLCSTKEFDHLPYNTHQYIIKKKAHWNHPQELHRSQPMIGTYHSLTHSPSIKPFENHRSKGM